MDCRERIVTTPDTLFGKLRIKGPRIGVEFVMQLFASGRTEAQVHERYPIPIAALERWSYCPRQ